MNIYKINKIFSSPNKAKIIAHFWKCQCQNWCLNQLELKLQLSQTNLSKHINELLNLNILKAKKIGKEKFCYINQSWKKKWFNLVDLILQAKENQKYLCNCKHSN